MTISYEIILTIVNLVNNQTKVFTKDFLFDLNLSDNNLYNNHHIIANKVKMLSLFKQEIDTYCIRNNVTLNNIDIDEFNINSLTDRVDVYFEPGDGDDPSQISLEPIIKCYVYPKYDALIAPELTGEVYDDSTIIWSWEDDGQSHYIVSEAIDIENEDNRDKIIAQIPININSYTETGLEANTLYTRRLIAYNENQTSLPSRPCTLQTAIAPIDKSLEQYEVPKNYDYTSDDSERELIQERLEAFHSGIGDYNDLKVYKQMDADFYQKFQAYIQLRGSRKQREKRYDSVGFNYKVCLEAVETVEEQKGEVTFDVDVYPREYISIKDYMYSTQPVVVCARMRADVLLKKKKDDNVAIKCPLKEPEWEKQEKEVPNEWVPHKWVEDEPEPVQPEPFNGFLTVVLSFDISGSMLINDGNGRRWDLVRDASLDLIDKIEAYNKDGVALAGKVKYALTFWGKNAMTKAGYTANEAKGIINSVSFPANVKDKPGTVSAWNFTPVNLTNHYAGLTDWKGKPGVTEAVVEMFFTDGFANTDGNCKWTAYEGHTGHEQEVYNSITAAYQAIAGTQCFTLFGANYQTDCDQAVDKIWNGWGKNAIINFDKKIYDLHVAAPNSVVDQLSYSNYSKANILNSMWNGLKGLIDAYQSSQQQPQQPQEPTGHYVDENGNETEETGHYVDQNGNRTTEKSHKEPDGWKFKGWKDVSNKIELTVNWDIDECKWARVYVPPLDQDPWTIEINDTITPIVYARNEQRAIIPSDSIIVDKNFDVDYVPRQSAIQVDSTDIQTLLLNEVKKSSIYQEGYTELVEAFTDEEKKQGQYIIRGLIIKDTYKYADEDDIPDVNFKDDGLEDGYVGSINVYAEINKLETGVFGDDIYAVGPDKYVWLSGYTDAIIYDGERIESFELNASNNEPSHNNPEDHQTQILISPNEDYRQYLWNRKKNTIQYTGENNIIRHCVDLISKDKDIYITGSNTLINVGDWTLFVPDGTNISDTNKIVRGVTYPVIEFLSGAGDIIAHNDEHYQSPILNYRFNYTDPDAYTSYYELLPDCDPFSQYQNIVFVHIYYARNIYIQDEEKLSGSSTVYIESFGTDNIATRSSSFYANSVEILGQTYFRDDYIDDYIWFRAKPMMETRSYYDEKPNPGMDSFYGNVNGRYRENNKSGRQDLRVVTPQFNLPTTIDANNIKIYIMITEFYPDSALVSYKWEHPSSEKDSITKTNGDYVTFSSDSLVYKDIVYNELIQTITTEPLELFDNKTTLKYFQLTKPLTKYTFEHYYIELVTNNSDVLALNYPSEVIFDENDKAEFGANFKGVVNATTKWSPRIHNGYYYLNQHEYYAYSQFDVDADFESYNEENFKIVNGYVTIDVDILHKAGPQEHYDILKNTRAELIQDETKFTWLDGKGLTILPTIDGEYYKEYTSYIYTSPIILFPNTLTSAGRLRVDYYFEDGSTYLPMQVRSYNMLENKWSDWVAFSNNQVPSCPLSCAYQVKFTFSATLRQNEKTIDDYLCCYLDWCDDEGDNPQHTNCVTITDHLQAGPNEADGIYNSKIIDFGCMTTIDLDIFASNLNKECVLYVATENFNKDKLLLENISWKRADGGKISLRSRFFRYRIVIPYGEKLYWLHKKVLTKQTEILLPILTQIQMTGDYTPVDSYDTFQEIQSFEIMTNGEEYKIFDSIYNIISGDIDEKGYTVNDIHYVTIRTTENNINLRYDNSVIEEYPTLENLDTPIYAVADVETQISAQHTPYIYSSVDPAKDLDVIDIRRGTPQQYCPITVEDEYSTSYKEVFDVDSNTMQKTEEFKITTEDDRHYIKISRNDYDPKTLVFYLNEIPFKDYKIVNNLIIFKNLLNINDELVVKYNILNSFYTEVDYDNDKTKITIYSDYDSETAKKDELKNIVPIIEKKAYRECRMDQIYANGLKFTVGNNVFYDDPNWQYNPDLNAIYYSHDTDRMSMIINHLIPLRSYELTIDAYSRSSSNNIIGIVACYIITSDSKKHTLSFIVSLDEENHYFNGNIALVLDYGISPKIIASKNIDNPYYTNWLSMSNGIRFYILKTSENIQCKISKWNNIEEWNENSTLSVNLNTEDLDIFIDSVNYGFCCQSQKNTYFINPVFTGILDRTITIDEQLSKLKHKYKVYFETNKTNNKFIAENLSLNPIYRTDYKGFIYLTDKHNEPYKINIYRNPKYIKAGGYDKIDISIECLDIDGNPVISKDIDIDCKAGILNFDDDRAAKHLTDMNGVIHVLYESAVETCIDIVKARTTTSDGVIISASVDIVNE